MSSSESLIDGKVEVFCNQILKTDSEFWEIRNKAVLGLTSLISSYEGADSNKIQEVFNSNVFRLLKDPVKDIVSDLRSQQIRDICLFLIKFSEVAKDHMKIFLRETFNSILEGVKVPNRVMSGYVDHAILTMIKNTTFKTCIPHLIFEIRDSKAKLVRERCLDYLNEILIHWEITEKEADNIADAIKTGLEDAAVKGREIARMAYLNFHLLFPKKTEKIKANISASLRQRLLKAERDCIGPILQAQEEARQQALVEIQIAQEEIAITVAEPVDSEMLIITSPVKIANLRARRQSCEESAISSIQAIIRGRKCRRMTMSMQISAGSDFGSPSSSIQEKEICSSGFKEYKALICSPSIASKAPFSHNINLKTNAKGDKASFDCGDDTSGSKIDLKKDARTALNSIVGLLKVKAAMTLKLLEEQLASIEDIEQEQRTLENEDVSIDEGYSLQKKKKCQEIVGKSTFSSKNEANLAKEFQRRLGNLTF